VNQTPHQALWEEMTGFPPFFKHFKSFEEKEKQ
jgi:hypothetical protein